MIRDMNHVLDPGVRCQLFILTCAGSSDKLGKIREGRHCVARMLKGTSLQVTRFIKPKAAHRPLMNKGKEGQGVKRPISGGLHTIQQSA